MMEFRDGMFQLILADYPFFKIKAAFIQHIRRSRDLPCPADIVAIIDPEPEPLSASVYIELGKKAREGGYLMQHERDYRRAFEEQEMAKTRGGSELLRESQRQVDNYAKKYWAE